MTLSIRPQSHADSAGIEALTRAAFLHAAHSSHSEQYIVEALRRAGQLTVSLMAEQAGVVLGEPAYYGHFGLKAEPDLRLEAVPPQYFMAQAFGTALPRATVTYHPAFNVQG